MNMDDERSGKVASVLNNKTSKKILEYLTDNSETSEEDISKDLKMPINTVEYNLKKLLETGLIKKSKKFFWSKRGKKINLYEVSNKHIVISPKSTKPSMSILKTILPIMTTAVLIVALILLLNPSVTQIEQDPNTFGSLKELEDYLKDNKIEGNSGFGGIFSTRMPETAMFAESVDSGKVSAASSGSNDYSTTNIQVEGVYEADIVKNDGKYINS